MQGTVRYLAPVVAVGLGILGFRALAGSSTPPPEDAPTLAAVYAPPIESVETHVLASGETLSDVLGRAAFTGQELADLLLNVREFVNPRRLVGGVEITVRRWLSNDAPRAIDLRVNADTTVRLTRASLGWAGDVVITPVVLDTVYTQGRIAEGTTTLFQALVYSEEDDVPITDRTQLVYRLAEIYEFKIDFTREIQPGDSYRLVYEREVRPDGTARSQRILAAEMVNQTQTYTAVWFSQGEDAQGYYDREGRPLQVGFSRYPVSYRITSSFNPRRYHPVLGIYRAHLGTDFGAPAGTPVEATADGTISFAGVSGGYGNLVRIRHTNGYETRYAHLRAFARGVRPGVKVKQKQVIGYVGATGLVTAAHLHYELRRNGQAVNARTAKLPEAPPLQGDAKIAFDGVSVGRLTLLDSGTRQYLARQTARGTRLADDAE
jgi:murein DD-endopeptidase MepM/ murein hydrolase activator NlpD